MSTQTSRGRPAVKRKRAETSVGTPKPGKKKKSEDLPSNPPLSITVVNFVENRAAEIVALTEQVGKIGGTKVISQKLPRHMRRRALSHDIRRLPRRLREAAAKEIEKSSSTKRPSRKHRRRPKNLLSEYQRRQRRVGWLDTHVWHAKRFHMVEQWGYRLAHHPTNKSMRASHRAADKYCLLQDVSFECCIEVTGREEVMSKCLGHLVSDQTGPTILSKQYFGGDKWGETIMYACDQYPNKPIGQISFLWRPCSTDNKSWRQLWIWCHPSCFEQLWKEMEQSLRVELAMTGRSQTSSSKQTVLTVTDDNSFNGSESPTASGNKVEHLRNLVFEAPGIKLKSLKDDMVKFRLTGQRSQAIVSEVLRPGDVNSGGEGDLWWQKYYSGKDNLAGFDEQKQLSDWMKTSLTPTETPPFKVVALTVRDPRVLMPPKRTKLMPALEAPEQTDFPVVNDVALTSPLWDEEVRTEVETKKMSVHELNKCREENIVPGSAVELGAAESRIPVLLLQRPGFRRSRSSAACVPDGFGCGWDVIAPPGWGMAFLIAFVFRGARVGGLREAEAVFRESECLHFPADFPDTRAGAEHAEELEEELQKKFDRNPPAKRPNYVKMGVPHPFVCPWSMLVHEWQGSVGVEETSPQFVVLRDLKKLNLLDAAMSVQKGSENQTSRFDSFPQKNELIDLRNVSSNSMVALRITMHGKGVPGQFAHVCIPKDVDFQCLEKSLDQIPCPCEPKHPDSNGNSEKRERKLKKKAKRMKSKDLLSALDNPSNPMEVALAQMLNNADKLEGKKPEAVKPMIQSASRQIIGFVNDGGFSLAQGHGHGKAFCSLLGLIQLLKDVPEDRPCLVLVRNTSTLQYRFAHVSVIM